MERLHDLSQVCGHKWLINYLENKLETNSVPHFIIFDGPEGTGKTTIADLLAIRLIYGKNPDESIVKRVIDEHHDTDSIKKFVMSVEGGKEAAKAVLSEMTSSFMQSTKVILCDECHGLSAAAQDVFLDQSEFIPNNVYLFMMTTDPGALKATLRSRAVPIHLTPLTQTDMLKLLQREVDKKQLQLQDPDATLRMIANWSENKPRTGLSILSAFSKGEKVSSNLIRELIGYLDIDDVLPVLRNLGASMVDGLSYIADMNISQSIVSIVSEVLRVKAGYHSYSLKMDKHTEVIEALQNVTTDQITQFLYGLTSQSQVTRSVIINSFIRAHKNYSTIFKETPKEVLSLEAGQKQANAIMQVPNKQDKIQVPTLSSLLENSSIVEDS